MILIKIKFDTDMALILTMIWTNGHDLDLDILIMIRTNGPGLDPNILTLISLNIFYCQNIYSNGVGSQVLTTLVSTLPLHSTCIYTQ